MRLFLASRHTRRLTYQESADVAIDSVRHRCELRSEYRLYRKEFGLSPFLARRAALGACLLINGGRIGVQS